MLAFVSFASLGCEALVDVNKQCAQTSDCEQLFGAGHVCGAQGVCARSSTGRSSAMTGLPARWACVGKPDRVIEPDSERTASLTLAVYDYVTGAPVSGATVRACSHFDVTCARPLGDAVVAGDDGTLRLDLPYGFDGHFELSADGMLPLILSDAPLLEDGLARIPMLSQAIVAATAKEAGDHYDPKLGSVLFDVVDCDGRPGEGVRFETTGDRDNPAFYFNDQLPTSDLDHTMVTTMGQPPQAVALAGFVNVAPGFVTFDAILQPDHIHLTYITLQVRARTLTLMRFRPGVP